MLFTGNARMNQMPKIVRILIATPLAAAVKAEMRKRDVEVVRRNPAKKIFARKKITVKKR